MSKRTRNVAARLTRLLAGGRNRDADQAAEAPAPSPMPDRPPFDSFDPTPWSHPFLTTENIRRFREYSAAVWQFALDYQRRHPEPLRAAFAVNMAQNMYKWARLAVAEGWPVTLFLHPQDQTALSRPEWEEFDGEYPDLFDGPGFCHAHPSLTPTVPCRSVPMGDDLLYDAYLRFLRGDRRDLYRHLAAAPGLRHEGMVAYQGVYPYWNWARGLLPFDVVYAASVPVPAYLSGRPYCAFSVGGDLQTDCGRGDDYGAVTGLAFNAARFLILSNPHPLAHCRRLGFANAVYLPYPMDDDRYCPGRARSRPAWEARWGPGVYVLSTCRIDNAVKGNSQSLLDALAEVARARPQVRFVFLSWGHDAAQLRDRVQERGLGGQVIFLPPVGKQRLLDYYRSCDVVLDQFVFGYYGATALEAAAVGCPIVMRINERHYAPLYAGDVAPVQNAAGPAQVRDVLLRLVDLPDVRREVGARLRQWLVRTHGARTTVPTLLALLRLTARGVALPADLRSPLAHPLTEAETARHEACLVRPAAA
jgi:glycosyltransferase involved in cell wall biosynthesis